MYSFIKSFPIHLDDALQICAKSPVIKKKATIQDVVIAGVGGSAIAGSIIQKWFQQVVNKPIVVHQNYSLPQYINKNTLLIINSYSGNTIETFTCLEIGIKVGANIVCLTSGGKIYALAKKYSIDCIMIPKGIPPRACLGYTIIFIMHVLGSYAILAKNYTKEIRKCINKIEIKQSYIYAKAKKIANKIKSRDIILYTAINEEAIAVRWRQQINENSKRLCWHHVYPEICHNEIVAWRKSKNYVILFLRTDYEHDMIKKSMEITQKILQKYVDIFNIFAQGDTLIEQTLYLIHLGDWLSYALALLENIDPVPITHVDNIKKSLQGYSTIF